LRYELIVLDEMAYVAMPLGNRPFSGYADSTPVLALDPNQLPERRRSAA
jgi:hypothetical protein